MYSRCRRKKMILKPNFMKLKRKLTEHHHGRQHCSKSWCVHASALMKPQKQWCRNATIVQCKQLQDSIEDLWNAMRHELYSFCYITTLYNIIQKFQLLERRQVYVFKFSLQQMNLSYGPNYATAMLLLGLTGFWFRWWFTTETKRIQLKNAKGTIETVSMHTKCQLQIKKMRENRI